MAVSTINSEPSAAASNTARSSQRCSRCSVLRRSRVRFAGRLGVGERVVEPEREPLGETDLVREPLMPHVVARDLHRPPHLAQPGLGPDQPRCRRLPLCQLHPEGRQFVRVEHALFDRTDP